MISDEIKEKLQKIDSISLINILLSIYENNPSIRGDIDVLIAVKSDDAKEAVAVIKKEISSIKRSSRFIDYYAARDFSLKLDNMRDSILNLSTKHPKEAFGLMKSFMENHESVLNRCDDSDGVISGTYREACDKLGEIGNLSNIPVDKAVELVFEMFTENPFGIYDGIIRSFKDVLSNEGLELLKSKLMSRLCDKQIESEAIKKKELIDSEELYSETDDVICLEDCIKETADYIS